MTSASGARARAMLLGVLLAAGPGLGRAAPQPPPAPTVAVLAPDASLVAAQTGFRVRVWRRATGESLADFAHVGFFRGALAASALLAVSDEAGLIVRRGPRFAEVVPLSLPRVLVISRTALSADGRVAAALFPRDGGAGDPDSVALWDATSGRSLGRILLDADELAGRGRRARGSAPADRAEPARVLGATLSVDGELLALFGDRPGKEALLELYRLTRAGRPRRLLSWRSARDRTTYCAAISGDRRWLALGAGTRLLLWDLRSRRLVAEAETDRAKALFPPELRGPGVHLPGAHQVAFRADGKELLTLHGFGVVGVARWSVQPLAPLAWLKRPGRGGLMRALAWDAAGSPWLVTSDYGPEVTLHQPRGDRFHPVRVLGR